MITLNGDNPLQIHQGDSFDDPGAISDGGEEITISGSFDTNYPGTYTLTYIAVDAAGNVGTAVRDIIVSKFMLNL